MKFLLKPLIMSTLLSSTGLFFTVSYASNDIPFILNGQLTTASQLYKFSRTDSNIDKSVDSFNELIRKPLLKIPKDLPPIFTNQRQGNRSDFFELSAIFNDKLQSFIAYLDRSISSNNVTIDSQTKLASACKSKS